MLWFDEKASINCLNLVVLFSNAKLKLKLFYDKFVIVVNYKHSILFYDFVKEKQ